MDSKTNTLDATKTIIPIICWEFVLVTEKTNNHVLNISNIHNTRYFDPRISFKPISKLS